MSFSDEVRDGWVGRIPVWVFGVILAAAIILFVVVRNHFKSKQVGDTPSDVPTEFDPSLDSVENIPAQSFADQLSNNFPQNVSLAPLPQRPITNAQWLIAATDYLVGLGKIPLDVQRALQEYLAGHSLTQDQQQLVNTAIQNTALGLPPEGANLAPLPPADGGGSSGGGGSNTTPQYLPAPIGTNLYDWVDSLDHDYNLGLGADTGSRFVRMFGRIPGDPTALNPGARNWMTWETVAGANYKIPKFKAGAPAMRIR